MKILQLEKSTIQGFPVLTENWPTTDSVYVGLWISRGARHDPLNFAGVAHFFEHLAFKGTQKRSAFEIVSSIEAVGGDLNAYTSKDSVFFCAQVLSEDMPMTVDVLVDMVFRAKLDPLEIDLERKVICEEIHMDEDNVEEAVFEKFLSEFFPNDGLGRPILGTEETLEGINNNVLEEFRSRCIREGRIIFAAVGKVNHDNFCSVIEEALRPEFENFVTERNASNDLSSAVPRSFSKVVKKETLATHCILGFEGLSVKDSKRYALMLANTYLGGGMNSRLYQTIREEKGLAYSVFSQTNSFEDCGVLWLYAGCSPKNAPDVIQIMLLEIETLIQQGLTRKELSQMQRQVSGQIRLGFEDLEGRLQSLCSQEMLWQKIKPIEETLDNLMSVRLQDIEETVDIVFRSGESGRYCLGNLPSEAFSVWLKGEKK